MSESNSSQQNQSNNQQLSLSLEQKLELFNEYFMIEQDVNVNVIPFEPNRQLCSFDSFVRQMPYSFRLASEVSNLEASSLRPLRNIGSIGDELVEFLKAQSRKIDLIMSYILTMEDDDDNRYVSHAFGGGGVAIISDKPIPIGQLAELKLFLTDEASAIFCYGEVVSCQTSPTNPEQYLVSLYYARIREEDREIIVRASLHQQSKQLKRKAESKRQS